MKTRINLIIASMVLAAGCRGFAAVHYVDLNSPSPSPPYTNWATAATVIQDAVDAAAAGDEIVATNGTYATGGRALSGMGTSRAAVDKPLRLRSVNGPQFTVLNGAGLVRCVYLTSGASLSGFTLTNGAADYGGGVYCASGSATALVSNCVVAGNIAVAGGGSGGGTYGGTLINCTISGNSAYYGGGGASGSTLNNCTVSGNQANNGGGISDGGGTYFCTVNNCTLKGNWAVQGGGAFFGTLTNCALTANTASSTGGGADGSTLKNCAFTGNSAGGGGGAYACRLSNCTLAGNWASQGGGAQGSMLNNCLLTGNPASYGGGGADSSTLINCTLTGNSASDGGGVTGSMLTNCIVYYNQAPSDPNYEPSSTLSYCCTTPQFTNGVGNISVDPQLASASHLSADSPCIGKGTYAAVGGVDIDGEPWANPPSIGCDEYHPGSLTGPLSVAITASFTNVAVNYPVNFSGFIDGRTDLSVWDFGDGSVEINQPYTTRAWTAPGDYLVALWSFNESHPEGVSATVTIHVVPGIYYVSSRSANPSPPYTSWMTAATNIQDAVDAVSVPGATVVVTNGTYSAGGRPIYGTLTNRVAVDKPLTLRSVNGPQFTVIQGYQAPGTTNGDSAVRCVYLTNGASLFGFTLTNGGTRDDSGDADQVAEQSGGGLWCESTNAVVSNCVLNGNCAFYNGGGAYQGTLNNCSLTSNSASSSGGGAYLSELNNCVLTGNSAAQNGGATGGYRHYVNPPDVQNGDDYAFVISAGCTLNNCILTGNSAGAGGGDYNGSLNNCALSGNSANGYYDGYDDNSPGLGGGAFYSSLTNCTLSGNSASSTGGGVSQGTVYNCIVYFDTAQIGANYDNDSTLNYSCTIPLPASGVGNISADPRLLSSSHLSPNSPCRGAGNAAYATGVDIDGQAWANPPSMGCDEPYPGTETGPLSVAIQASFTNVATGFEVNFAAQIVGQPSGSRWDFGDGVVVTNRLYPSHAWTAVGDYVVVLSAFNQSYPAGVSATVTIHVVMPPVHYVSAGSTNPVPPYASWLMAATNIQDAVDSASGAGALVLVTNGTYAGGGQALAAGTVAMVGKPLTLRSMNGPQFTMINGVGSVQCVYLASGASLSGFTLTNGWANNGGGVFCALATSVVSNCVVGGNQAVDYIGDGSDGNGGGALGGTLINCTLTRNSASSVGGGAEASTLTNCVLSGNSAGTGGGAYLSDLDNCVLTANSAFYNGGGAYQGTLNNCSLTSNSGGAAYGSSLANCAVNYNDTGAGNCTLVNCTVVGNSAGGVFAATLTNCIVYYNDISAGANYDAASTLNYCCTTPLPPSGTGNLASEPQLASASHLGADSPCIGRGAYVAVSGVDIDGEPWANPPSIGCDEYYPGNLTGPMTVAITATYTNVGVGYPASLTALIEGRTASSVWEFGDGVVETNRLYTTHAWIVPGDYQVVLWAFNESYPEGISATVTVRVVDQSVWYVAASSGNPMVPYSSWATAARTIQAAVGAAVPGAVVLVTNGAYTGGVVLNQPLALRSVNGPQFTVINGLGRERCVFLPSGANVSGFTLTRGMSSDNGGGVFCVSATAVVSNCVLTGNSAQYAGGGAAHGTLVNCLLNNNSAGLGGGVAWGDTTLNNCTLTGNSASDSTTPDIEVLENDRFSPQFGSRVL